MAGSDPAFCGAVASDPQLEQYWLVRRFAPRQSRSKHVTMRVIMGGIPPL